MIVNAHNTRKNTQRTSTRFSFSFSFLFFLSLIFLSFSVCLIGFLYHTLMFWTSPLLMDLRIQQNIQW